jgi:hypothetical protein
MQTASVATTAILTQPADALRRTLIALLDAIPGAPHRPTPLSARLGINRVTVSRLLSALRAASPFELLETIPGPESLRAATLAARALSCDAAIVDAADAAIDDFDNLIRGHFGTRATLSAAVRPLIESLRERVDCVGRADVFKGMRQILGVEAQTWLTAMFFVPGDDDQVVATTTIHGAIEMRRLRPDTHVHFTFGSPYPANSDARDRSDGGTDLGEFCVNETARLESVLVGDLLRHRLIEERLGKDAVVDMLAVSHDLRGSRRYATPEAPLRGVSLFVDIPVRSLVFDAIVHRDIFPGRRPRLIVFNPGARGPANPNDPRRALDRIEVGEAPAEIAADAHRFSLEEVPNYHGMAERVCAGLRRSLDEFRVYRLLLAYPVIGFQYVLAFEAPHARP